MRQSAVGHRRARPRQRNRLRPPQRSGRSRVPGTDHDPLEPNDDLDYVRRAGILQRHPAADDEGEAVDELPARLTAVEDPRDVYRVFVPARGSVTVKTTVAAGVALVLWGSATQTVTQATPNGNRLARGIAAKGSVTLTFKNSGAAKTVYLAVTPATGVRESTYKLAVVAR